MNNPASRHRFGASLDARSTVRDVMPVTSSSAAGARKRQVNTQRFMPPFAYRQKMCRMPIRNASWFRPDDGPNSVICAWAPLPDVRWNAAVAYMSVRLERE